jgi:hypothetical protein
MLTAFQSLLRNRRDWQDMLNMRIMVLVISSASDLATARTVYRLK